MSEVIHISDRSEFQDLLDTEDTLLVVFTAPSWCAPCRALKPHYEVAASKTDVPFVSVDIDEADWAPADFGIMSVPTVRLFKHGEAVEDLSARSSVALLSALDILL